MANSIMQAVAAAKAIVAPISPDELKGMVGREDTVIVDVRDPAELADTGKIPGALNVSRGMLEFRACESSPMHDETFSKDKTVVVYCASGGRAALAGKTLIDLGFSDVRSLGALKSWTEAGGEVEPA